MYNLYKKYFWSKDNKKTLSPNIHFYSFHGHETFVAWGPGSRMETTFPSYPAAGCGCVKETCQQKCNKGSVNHFTSKTTRTDILHLLLCTASGMWRPCCFRKIRAALERICGLPTSLGMVDLQALSENKWKHRVCSWIAHVQVPAPPLTSCKILEKLTPLWLIFLIYKLEIARSHRGL